MKAVIFDLFGVLYIDRWKEWLEENKMQLEKFASQPDLPLKDKGLRPGYPDYYSDLINFNAPSSIPEHKITDAQFYEVLSCASGIPEKEIRYVIHDTSVVNKDMVNLIKELKSAGYKIGLLTNGDRKIANEFINVGDLYKLLDAVVTSEDVGKLKPDPLMFKKIAQELKLPLNEMVLIDDSRKNVEGAKKAGMKAIYYDNQAAGIIKKEISSLLNN